MLRKEEVRPDLLFSVLLKLESPTMDRPKQYHEFRYIGDKRTQVVYDLDNADNDSASIDELVESEQVATFGPDTLPEARNRGYRLRTA